MTRKLFILLAFCLWTLGSVMAQDPTKQTDTIEYDSESNSYVRITKVGNVEINRNYMTFDEYQDWQMDQLMRKYWDEKVKSAETFTTDDNLLSKIPGFSEVSKKVESLLGTKDIQINPTGSVDLTFQLVNNFRDNPAIDVSERSNTTFDFDENIQLSMNVKIGDLVDFDVNWNTQATFDFENKIKFKYEGKEDEIVQLAEVGNISFPLNTRLIKGSQQLFGAHTKLKFGKLTIDAVGSKKETSTENMQIQGGASTQEFEIRADEYEENRHYFISQYFYENYNKAMSTLPVVNSNIKIIRMEVWRTNVGAAVTNNRNILALKDLGERNPTSPGVIGMIGTLPGNNANNILQVINPSAIRNIDGVTNHMEGMGFVGGTDYEKIESARLLNSNEYTYNSRLGFISLNQPLSNDQVLAVAFQYQVIGDTNVYQVGELTTDGVNDPNTLVVKLIKGTATDTRSTLWKLMMKNVYFLRSTQLSPDKFRLNILYENPEGGMGIGYFTEGPKEGVPLIEVFGMDRMDASKNYYYSDGVFDWFDSAAYKGGLIQSTTGRLYFPYVEPFGKDLRQILGDDSFADQYCFDSLYTMTQTLARQYADKNKFYLEGYYTSSVSGEISLGYSVTQGSVTVTAGGMPLVENVDYIVDYTMGTVRIINESILSSGTPISVSSENNSFSMISKRMLGVHLNYEIDPTFNIGATWMNLYEKPLTQKNNFGEEPTSNSIWGVDLNYRHEAPFITKLVDLLPGIQTKAPSNLTIQAEFAHFIPGMTNVGGQEGRVSYIDDFEGAKSSIDLRSVFNWHLASTPQDFRSTNPMFPETAIGTGLAYGFNRARLAWYRIDDIFYEDRNRPDNITEDDRSNPYARRLSETEVFPNKELAPGELTRIYELNLAYYPSDRGPYNYDVNPSSFSAGIDENGKLKRPETRWGGIMRSLDYTDFETQNIETIEFWVMDPFIDPETGQTDATKKGGKLYFNLGDISEDILRDGKKMFENGFNADGSNMDTTIWGRVPTTQPIVNAFDNNETERKYQDVGYDGLSSSFGMTDEQSFFADYLNEIALKYGTSSEAYRLANEDPSGDDFMYYRSSYYDEHDVKINERYKYFNNPEGNSPVDADNTESYPTSASNLPNVEDINRDNTLSEAENYYQYEIDLVPSKMVIGENHIVDIQEASNIQLPNGKITSCKWYQFRIPIREPDKKVGKINGFQSIRFIRMFLSQFEEPVILRFATLELVYGTWRKYTEDLMQPGDYPTGTGASTSFSISTVNIEENGSREPVPYVLPDGIEREQWYTSSSQYTQMNEQSLSLDVTDLSSGDARAVYRSTSYDLRYYGKMKMFVHAEKKNLNDQLDDDDLSLFVRLGSDYTNNYYEYEVPLKLTPWHTGKEAPNLIWPEENNVEIDLQRLVELKTSRNTEMRAGNSDYSTTQIYSEYNSGRKYSVLGTPNLGKVKVIMIGVRNPRKQSVTDGNDMEPKSAIIWVNELRLSDYTNKGGWTAMALARTNLADIGNLSLYGAYTTAGFGNLEDNLTNLELVNNLNTQATLDLELGKFLPEKWSVHIPFYLDYNNEIGSPEYNPLDPDVLLADDLKTYQTQAEQDSIKLATQERHSTTNLTLTNIRKERTGKAALNPHFYDLANFSLSYAYSRERSSDDEIQYFNKDLHRGTLNYSFNTTPKEVKPFNNIKLFQNKNFKFIKDFNFYYQPKNLTFSTEIYRDYEETQLRNKSAALIIMNPTYFKQFTWRRDYGFNYDLARSIKLEYTAGANARIDEPIGRIDQEGYKDSIMNSIMNGGTMQNFQQNVKITWNVPINKLPYMDFLQTPIVYRTSYNYEGTTQALASMGSTIQNATQIQASASANMSTLYNKFPFIKKAQAPKSSNTPPQRGKKPGLQPVKKSIPDSLLTQSQKDSIHREKIHEALREVLYFGVRFITGIKTANLQYSVSSGAIIPGFMGEATFFGMDPNYAWNPGPGFVFGTNTSIVETLRNQDLLSIDTLLNAPHQNSTNKVLSYQATLEPIRDFRIEINGSQNYASREEYYYKYNSVMDMIDGPLSYVMTGSYTTTCWTMGSAFTDNEELYQTFLNNRMAVATQLANLNPDPYSDQFIQDTVTGQYYPAGYSGNQQTVLLTSFLNTYMGGKSVQGFSPFAKMPLPNWSVNYTGLNKIKFLKKWFTNISIAHKYSSTYSISNFYTDAAISGTQNYDYGSETVLNGSGDYIAPVSMEGVQISEQFSPLLRLSFSMVNSFQFNFSVQKSRLLALSFSNNQLTETTRDGVTVGTGYRFKDVEINIKTADKIHNLKSDVVLQLNLTYNSNKTEIRKINQYPNANSSQISAGSGSWMAEISGEYQLSSTMTLKAFFRTNINNPYIYNSYPNSTTKGGLTLRFSF